MVRQARQMEASVLGRYEQGWQVFLLQMENKLAEGTFDRAILSRLYFFKGATNQCSISFNKSKGEVAIKDNGGHEVVLSDVDYVNFRREGQNVLTTVIFKNGEVRYAKWTIPET